ncbi:hypothetical protein BD414DRAFT_269079 [Trametes punicea]|nr:hypothetical protein BD414DRAFT_269079 [Trametes punicea]
MPASSKRGYNSASTRNLSSPHTKMIFTTVVVTCLFALLGVFQQVSVNTIFSNLALIHTPALSAITTTFLHVTGSVTRLALDTAALPEVDISHLPYATLDDALTNLTLNLPDVLTNLTLNLPDVLSEPDFSVPTDANPVDSPPEAQAETEAPFRQQVIYIASRLAIFVLAHFLRKVPRAVLFVRPTEKPQPPECPVETVSPSAYKHDEDDETQCDDDCTEPAFDHLLFFFSPPTLDEINIITAPRPVYCPPSMSTDSNLADVDDEMPTHVFGHTRYPTTITTENGDEDVEDDIAYIRDALNLPADDAPPLAGWCSEDVPPAMRPEVDVLDAWTLPRQQAEGPSDEVAVIETG